MPYTYGPLVSDIYISSDMTDVAPDTRPVITNMAEYARFGFGVRVTEIPSGHLPTDINTSLAQDWYRAFNNCRYLTSLPDPFYDTSNATSMEDMFGYCFKLTTVPNFNTSNVTDMSMMFESCRNLITVPNFDTSNATSMHGMLHWCNNLTTVPNFDTNNVTDMQAMFWSCSNLTTIPILNIGKVYSIKFMFVNCYNIQGNLYIESNNITNAIDLFSNTPNYIKNVYCHANTQTYNTIYTNMGNTAYCNYWNTYLYTMEDNYATISWNGNGIYRFPTNKVSLYADSSTRNNIISVTPYTDYNLIETVNASGYPMIGRNDNGNIIPWYTLERSSGGTSWTFQFFKDISNMTANVVDLL